MIKFDFTNAQRNFASVVDELGKLPGFDRRGIIKAEAGSILKKCIAETRPPNLVKIERGVRLRAAKGLGLTRGGLVTINTGYKASAPWGRVFARKNGGGYRRTHDQDFVLAKPPAPSKGTSMRFPDAVWDAVSSSIDAFVNTLTRVLAEAKLSAGLAQQSWLLIAESLGINLLSVPGAGVSASTIRTAAAARGRRGVLYPNGLGAESTEAGKYFVTLTNRLPYGQRLGFSGILQAAIAGRVSYIQTSVARGTFKSFDEVCKRFTGWKATGGVN